MVAFMNSRKELVFFKKDKTENVKNQKLFIYSLWLLFSSMLDFYQRVTYFS